jgi:hypothetical protein
MDYQTYAFELLANSDLRGLVFTCDSGFCPYPSSIGNSQVSGEDVLHALAIEGISYGRYGEFTRLKSPRYGSHRAFKLASGSLSFSSTVSCKFFRVDELAAILRIMEPMYSYQPSPGPLPEQQQCERPQCPEVVRDDGDAVSSLIRRPAFVTS